MIDCVGMAMVVRALAPENITNLRRVLMLAQPDAHDMLLAHGTTAAADQFLSIHFPHNIAGQSRADAFASRGRSAMILGLSTSTFTTVHVIISLIGIVSGIVVLLGWLGGKRSEGWTAVFLTTTVLTSVTGFFFHSATFGPPQVIGLISLAVLAGAIPALYIFGLEGIWRPVYIVSALAALYFNVFVGVVQAFQKLPFLQPLAPTQSEPPFLIAQIAVLVVFVVLGFLSLKRFHPQARAAG
jgi:hypothetical protein